MRFRICPPGVILDIFKANQLDIGRYRCVVGQIQPYQFAMPQTLCDDFTQQNAEICANLLQMGTQWGSGSKCADAKLDQIGPFHSEELWPIFDVQARNGAKLKPSKKKPTF